MVCAIGRRWVFLLCRVAPAAGFALVRGCEMQVRLSKHLLRFSFKQPSAAPFGPVCLQGCQWQCLGCGVLHLHTCSAGALGKTPGGAEVLWNNSKLKILNQDKRRNKTIQGKAKTPSHSEGSVDAGSNEEQHPASFLLVSLLPCPCNKRKRRRVSDKKENAFVQNSLWTCSFLRLLSAITEQGYKRAG